MRRIKEQYEDGQSETYCPKSWDEYYRTMIHLLYSNCLDDMGHRLEESSSESFKTECHIYEQYLQKNGIWTYQFIENRV